MYARVPQALAQFVLNIEKLSHIMGTAPIVELARAYGLHPRADYGSCANPGLKVSRSNYYFFFVHKTVFCCLRFVTFEHSQDPN